VSALVVLLTNNVLYAAFSLLVTFLGMAGLYVIVGADFLGVAQILVYIGGILVLLIFGVMLTNQKGTKSQGRNDILTENTNRVIGLVVAAGMFGLLYFVFSKGHFAEVQASLFTDTPLKATTQTIGLQLMTDFVLPFEVSGVLLMAALLGAAYLSTKQK
jgi:NADH-quinone oxidoreductase subunit J